jgi:hypothetical protein
MYQMDQTTTVAVKACAACAGGLLEYDRFCRWCGAGQAAEAKSFDKVTSPYTTSALEQMSPRGDIYRPVSGPLVKAMVETVAANHSTRFYNRAATSLMQAIVSIPIWLMILLLSPLDAYAAAKTLYRQS